MVLASVQFTSTIGLGSIVAIIAILGFFGAIVRLVFRIARKIDQVDLLPDRVDKLITVVQAQGDEAKLFRERTALWQEHHQEFLHRKR